MAKTGAAAVAAVVVMQQQHEALGDTLARPAAVREDWRCQSAESPSTPL